MSGKIAEESPSRIGKRGHKIGSRFGAGGVGLRLSRNDARLAKPSKFPKTAAGDLTQFLKGNFGSAVKSFRKTFGISQEELGRLTGFSTRSIAGWESGQIFSSAGRQKLVEMERLRAALAQIMPSDAVGDWLREPNGAFENQPPLQVIERGEIDRLWQMIFQIDAGVAN